MKKVSPVIVGIKSEKLSYEEKLFLEEFKPLGIILFSRNIKNKSQVIYLIKSIKKILGIGCLILIDQEGGKVSRLDSLDFTSFRSSEYFGNIANNNIKLASRMVYINYYLIGCELRLLGINYNCAPVLDIRVREANEVIGSRSFSSDEVIVSELGKYACKGLRTSGIIPIIKHIPGHGRAKLDSHFALPDVDGLSKLFIKDIYPFKKNNNMPAAMTAHIKYLGIDSILPATQSKIIIKDIIRKKIGFSGILFSDDLCMRALEGSFEEITRLSLEAGCDIVLHCDGNIEDAKKVIKVAGTISNILKNKIKKTTDWIFSSSKETQSVESLKVELNKLISL